MKQILTLLQMICKYCSRVKLPDAVRRHFLREMRAKPDVLQKRAFYKEVVERAKKIKTCPYCGCANGMVKKVGALKLVHERFREKQHIDRRRQFLGEFDEAVKLDESLAPHLNKAQDDLNPIRIMNIFSRIPPEVRTTHAQPSLVRDVTPTRTVMLTSATCMCVCRIWS
jgi:DNA-directed RNA polymerase III subunit RPC1